MRNVRPVALSGVICGLVVGLSIPAPAGAAGKYDKRLEKAGRQLAHDKAEKRVQAVDQLTRLVLAGERSAAELEPVLADSADPARPAALALLGSSGPAVVAEIAAGPVPGPDPGFAGSKEGGELVKLLRKLHSSKPKDRTKAAAELAELFAAATRAVPLLLQARDDRSEAVAERARRTIGSTSPALLAHIAKAHPDAVLRRAAVGSIGDAPTLEALALSAPDEVRPLALAKIDDEARLARVVRAGDALAQTAALSRIADESIRADLARTGPEAVRVAAVAGIADTQRLGALARETTGDVQAAALAALVAQARDAAGLEMRLAALGQIEDPAAVIELATSASLAVSLAAVARIDDTAALARLSREHTSITVRLAALERVSDQTTLEQAAASDAVEEVRAAAVVRLIERAPLRQIARQDSSPAVRRAAAYMLKRKRDGRPLTAWIADLASPDDAASKAATSFLRGIGAAAVPGLVRTVAADDRRSAAAADRLLTMGKAACPSLVALLLHDEAVVREGAASVLVQLGAPAEAELRKALVEPETMLAAVGVLDAMPGGPAIGYELEVEKGWASFRKSILAKLRQGFGERAKLFECGVGEEACARLPRRVAVSLEVSDQGCYGQVLPGACLGTKGKQVRVSVRYFKGGDVIARDSAVASSPQVIHYKTYGVDFGPSESDVKNATAQELRDALTGFALNLDKEEVLPLFAMN